MQSRIYISEILTDRLIFLNQITFRCDILIIRNQIDSVFQSICNVIGIFSSCRSIIGCLRSSFSRIGRCKGICIFQGILNISNILFILGNVACICMDFSICLIYPAIGVRKMFFQILCTINDSLRVILNGCSQRFINLTLVS